MVARIQPKLWGQQKPPVGLKIDWGHQLAQGLANALYLSDQGGTHPVDSARLQTATMTAGSTAPLWLPNGVQFHGTVTGSTPEQIWVDPVLRSVGAVPDNTRIKGPFSLLASIWIAGNTNGGVIGIESGDIATNGTNATGAFLGIGGTTFDNTGKTLIGLNENLAWESSGVSVPSGQWVKIGLVSHATASAGGAVDYWINGVKVNTLTWGAILTGSSVAPMRLMIGGYYTSNGPTNRVFTGKIGFAYHWNRALSPSEMQWLNAEPYVFTESPDVPVKRFSVLAPAPPLVQSVALHKRPWDQQKPPAGSCINWGHPLANGLIACVLFNEQGGGGSNVGGGFGSAPRDIARNEAIPYGTNDGTGLLATGKRGGVGRQTGGSTGGQSGWTWPGQAPWLPTTSCTVVVAKRKLDSTNRASEAFGSGLSGVSPTNRLGCHLPYSDGVVYWDFGQASAPNRLTYTPAAFGDDIWAFTAGRRGSTIWQNGILRASQGTAITRINDTGGSQKFAIGTGQPGTMGTDFADHAFFYMWNRELTQSEIEWIQREPYAFIGPPAPANRIWAVIISGGNANPQAALGTGVGVGPGITIIPFPPVAAATGVGVNPTPGIGPTVPAAAGAGVGVAPTILIGPHPGSAAGTGAGVAAIPGIGITAGSATGAGVGIYATPGVGISPAASVGSGVGVATIPQVTIGPSPALAAGIGISPVFPLMPAPATGTGTGVNPIVTVITPIRVGRASMTQAVQPALQGKEATGQSGEWTPQTRVVEPAINEDTL